MERLGPVWIRSVEGEKNCVELHGTSDKAVARITAEGGVIDRLVACVNACDGISTQALEEGTILLMKAALRESTQYLEGSGPSVMHPDGEREIRLVDVVDSARDVLSKAESAGE